MRFWLLCIPLLWLGRPAPPTTQATITARIPLRFAEAASMARIVQTTKEMETLPDGRSEERPLLPEGITLVKPRMADNCLVVTGTPDAIAELKKRIALLDVQARQIRLEARLLRITVEEDGNWDMDVVMSPTLLTRNDAPATATIAYGKATYTLNLTPHLNADNTITLAASLRVPLRPETVKAERVVPNGRRVILLGITDAPDEEIQKQVLIGHLPTGKPGRYTAYYLQVTPGDDTVPKRTSVQDAGLKSPGKTKTR